MSSVINSNSNNQHVLSHLCLRQLYKEGTITSSISQKSKLNYWSKWCVQGHQLVSGGAGTWILALNDPTISSRERWAYLDKLQAMKSDMV